jgi:hypothetical protein
MRVSKALSPSGVPRMNKLPKCKFTVNIRTERDHVVVDVPSHGLRYLMPYPQPKPKPIVP